MGLRFYRRLHVLPGVRVNLTTRGASLSLGHRGLWYTIGRAGRRRATLGFGGGLYYTQTMNTGAAGRSRPTPLPARPSPAPSAARTLLWVLIAVAFLAILTHIR